MKHYPHAMIEQYYKDHPDRKEESDALTAKIENFDTEWEKQKKEMIAEARARQKKRSTNDHQKKCS
ncbi:MAG: hypothetical protein LIO96_07740 [Lachnospiraceae bacterium]|nr:hypothetical protein [Lachnospiraceae bacterium]